VSSNPVVSNSSTASNPDFTVRGTDLGAPGVLQHVRLDLGAGTAEAQATGAVPVSAASLPLPTGASTETTLAALNTKVTACNTGAVTVSSSALPTGASTETTLSALNAKVTACNTGAVVVSTLPATYAEDAPHTSSDLGIFALAVRNDNVSALTNTNLDYSPIAVDSAGRFPLNVNYNNQSSAATGLLKREDDPSVSLDAGVFILGIRRDAPATNVSAAGDYAEVGISGQGNQWTSLSPSIGGGWLPSSQTALSNTKTEIKATAGTFGGYMLDNPNATLVYVQVWNLPAASVTVGTTAPTYTIPIPPGAGANLEISNGIKHDTGITIAATTTPTGSTAAATALCGFFLYL
jgi:hypothetical protein